MAVDNRPFKSKEQDGQGNEIIIRDQQLVEQGTATTMASGAYFETRDVDDRPVKIPRDNMMNIVLECIGIILNDSSRNLGTNVQKALGLQGNTVGHSTVADFASVLGVSKIQNGVFKFYQTDKNEEAFYREDVSGGCVFFAYVSRNGLCGYYTGFKVSNEYGAMLTIGYGYGIDSSIGVLRESTWTWKSLS